MQYMADNRGCSCRCCFINRYVLTKIRKKCFGSGIRKKCKTVNLSKIKAIIAINNVIVNAKHNIQETISGANKKMANNNDD